MALDPYHDAKEAVVFGVKDDWLDYWVLDGGTLTIPLKRDMHMSWEPKVGDSIRVYPNGKYEKIDNLIDCKLLAVDPSHPPLLKVQTVITMPPSDWVWSDAPKQKYREKVAVCSDFGAVLKGVKSPMYPTEMYTCYVVNIGYYHSHKSHNLMKKLNVMWAVPRNQEINRIHDMEIFNVFRDCFGDFGNVFTKPPSLEEVAKLEKEANMVVSSTTPCTAGCTPKADVVVDIKTPEKEPKAVEQDTDQKMFDASAGDSHPLTVSVCYRSIKMSDRSIDGDTSRDIANTYVSSEAESSLMADDEDEVGGSVIKNIPVTAPIPPPRKSIHNEISRLASQKDADVKRALMIIMQNTVTRTVLEAIEPNATRILKESLGFEEKGDMGNQTIDIVEKAEWSS